MNGFAAYLECLNTLEHRSVTELAILQKRIAEVIEQGKGRKDDK